MQTHPVCDWGDAPPVDEIVKEFLVESDEDPDRLDRDLVALEKDPQAKDILASIFRTIHTLKGGSGYLGFGKLERGGRTPGSIDAAIARVSNGAAVASNSLSEQVAGLRQ